MNTTFTLSKISQTFRFHSLNTEFFTEKLKTSNFTFSCVFKKQKKNIHAKLKFLIKFNWNLFRKVLWVFAVWFAWRKVCTNLFWIFNQGKACANNVIFLQVLMTWLLELVLAVVSQLEYHERVSHTKFLQKIKFSGSTL